MSGWPVLLAHLRYQLGRHGWPGALGLALLIVAAGGYPLLVADVQRRTATAHEELATIKQRQAGGAEHPAGDAADQASAFYKLLPPASAADEAVKTLHAAARERGLGLSQGEYRLTQEGRGAVVRYQVTLPVRGTYPQFRGWLASVLNGLPSLAVEEMSLKRDDAARGEIEARVRLTLFLRAT